MLRGFYADTIMMLALGGASSLIENHPFWMLLLLVGISFGAIILPTQSKTPLAFCTLLLLGAYTLRPNLPTFFLAAIATLTASLITKQGNNKILSLIEAIVWAISLFLFPLVRSSNPLANQLQLALLCLTFAYGLCLSFLDKGTSSQRPIPLCLVLLLFWVLSR